MKIYTLNYSHGDNYGAVLVQIALQKVLSRYGSTVNINFVRNTEKKQETRMQWFLSRIKNILINPSRIKLYLRVLYTRLVPKLRQKQKDKLCFLNASSGVFKDFREKHFVRTEPIVSLEMLLKSLCLNKGDAVLCGSDVIWDQGNDIENIKTYFLHWVPDYVRKIAIAPSWGRADLTLINDEAKVLLSECLRRFQAVSVREESGVKICEELGRSDAKWLPDPTMLLTSNDWNEIAKSPEISNYVLNYMVPYNDAVDTLMTLSTFEEPAVKVPNLDAEQIWPAPEKWIGYIRDAHFVVTNSFHGVVFCLLYHKSFVYTQLIGDYAHYNDRLYSLLDRFNLMDRIITEETCNDKTKIQEIINKKINWQKIDASVSAWRKEAWEYLDHNLRNS